MSAAAALTLLMLSPSVSPEQLREAKVLVAAAKEDYRAGDVESAVLQFEAAYRKHAAPELLFDIAQCHRRLGHLREARAHYARFLELEPEAPVAPMVRRAIADLDAELISTVPAAPRAPPALQPRLLVTSRSADEARDLEPTPFYRTWWFWTVTGVVVAGAAGTAVALSTRDGDGAPAPTSLGAVDLR